jgi:hypothetical protein
MNKDIFRKLVLDELYEIAYNQKDLITEEGFSNKPATVTDDPKDGASTQPTDADTAQAAASAQAGSIGAEMQAQDKLAQAAIKCGWGRDIAGYKASGWDCKTKKVDPFTAEKGGIPALRAWRTWFKEKYPNEFKKIVPDGDITVKQQPGDVMYYYKYADKYDNYQRLVLNTGENLIDNTKPDLTGTQYVLLAAVVSIAGISALSYFGGVFKKLGLGRLIKLMKKYSRAKRIANIKKAKALASSAFQTPQAMTNEMGSLAKRSNAEIREYLSRLSSKSPSKFTDKQIDDIRTALNNPQIQTEVIVLTRRSMLNAFMSRGGGGVTAEQLKKYFTPAELEKVGPAIDKIARGRKNS